MFSLEAMINKLAEHSKMDTNRIRSMIADKQQELSGLVSEEGAAYIVARELGMNMIRETSKQLKVKNLVSGLRSVDLVARVVRTYDERTFEREGKTGSVINVLLGDETGVVRLSLWNQETELVKKGKIKEGDTIKISGGWVKTDNRDALEIRIGRGSVQKADQVIELPDRGQMEQTFQSVNRESISAFKEGGQYEARAALVQVFRKNPFFEVCPQCKSRIKESDGKFICDDHGEVQPEYGLVLSGIIDDGTDNMRAAFFRENAERMFGKTTAELREESAKSGDPLVIFDDVETIGREFIFTGRIKMNSYTENLEMMVNSVDDIDPMKEATELASQLS